MMKLGTTKTDTATILHVAQRHIDVQIASVCRTENSCHGCTLCAQKAPGIKVRVAVSPTSTYAIGQCVVLHRYVLHEALSALLVFGLPIATALACAFSAAMYLGGSDESPFVIVATFAGLAFGFGLGVASEALLRYRHPPVVQTGKPAIELSHKTPQRQIFEQT